ncbi:MAG: hypothetical protein RLZZ15_1340 [Verrucomicrobiota bacterium]
MKKSVQTLLAVVALGAFSLAASAQPALKLAVVDIAKLYDAHPKTVEYMAKLQEDQKKADDEISAMNTAGNGVVDEYKALVEQSNNPALTADAKGKAQAAAQAKLGEIEKRKGDRDQFFQNTRSSLGQRLQNFRNLMLEDISKVTTDVAKRKGATLVIDKSGPSGWSIPNIIYADAAYEITDDVLAEIKKANPAAAAPTAPATSAAPTITVPGLAPTKK